MSTWLFSYLVLVQQGMMKARGGLKCSTDAKRYQGSGQPRTVRAGTETVVVAGSVVTDRVHAADTPG